MKLFVVVVVYLTGCGRVSFTPDERADAGSVDGSDDAAPDGMASSLVLHLPFEGSTDDVAGGRTGTCSPCPNLVASRPGLGTAAKFTTTECIAVPDDPALRPAVFTYAMWVRPRLLQIATVFSKPAMATIEDSNSYELWVQDTPTFVFTTNDGTQQRFTLAGSYQPDTWYHVAASFDGTTKRLYIDGVEGAAGSAVPSNYDNEALRIGCDREFGALAHHFDGNVDDVRLYDRVLSASEISTLAQ